MSVVYDEKLLDKTGLAMVPSAYKGAADENNVGGFLGKVYSVLPVQTLSENLVTNGTFDQDSDWTHDTGWTIANGVATYDNDGIAGNLIQSGFLEEGKTYILKFDTLETNGGNFGYTMSGSITFINNIEANKTHEIKLVAESGNLRLRAASNFAGSIDNVSVRQVVDGDFDFSRGSDATRVNKDGLIESVQIVGDELVQNGGFDTTLGEELVENGDFEEIGDELVTNGGFDTDSDWSKGTNWTISDGKANCDGVSATSNFSQVITSFNGKTFLVEGSASNVSQGFAYISLGGTDLQITVNSNGSFKHYVTISSGNSTLFISARNNFIGSIDNISVKEVGQNWSFENGSIITKQGARINNTVTGTSAYILQSNANLTQGKLVLFEYDVVATNGKRCVIEQVGDDIQLDTLTTGTNKKVYFEFDRADTNLLIKRAETNTDVTIDNISVKEVQGLDDWEFGSGWSYEDGKVIADGTVTSADTLNYAYNFTDGNKYRFNFTISDYQSGSVYIREPFDGSADSVNSNGTFTFDYIAGTANEIRFRSNDGFTGSIDNISVKEITDDTDIPRLDYSDGACPTLLLEPQRRNLFTYSEKFSDNSWNKNDVTLSSYFVVSPDGKKNASELIITSTTPYLGSTPVITQGDTYTVSCFVKKGTNRWVRLTNGSSSVTGAWFDLENGVVGSRSASSLSSSIESYGNNWYKIQNTFIAQSNNNVLLGLSDSDGATTSAQNGNTVYAWGLQVEEGSYATSYIPTNGEGVTRLADICNNAGDSTIFNDSEGVLYAEVTDVKNGRIAIKNSDTNIDEIVLGLTGSQFFSRIRENSNNIFTEFSNNNLDMNLSYKLAIKYKSGDSSFWINGIGQSISDNFTLNSLNELLFTSEGNNFYGNVRSVLYFNEALSNAELEYITSSDIDVVLQNNKLKATMFGDTYEDGHVEDRLNELF